MHRSIPQLAQDRGLAGAGGAGQQFRSVRPTSARKVAESNARSSNSSMPESTPRKRHDRLGVTKCGSRSVQRAGQLHLIKARPRRSAERGFKSDHGATVVIIGHALIQKIRRGHFELGIGQPATRRIPAAFSELTLAISPK
jgi:hypothetical protein